MENTNCFNTIKIIVKIVEYSKHKFTYLRIASFSEKMDCLLKTINRMIAMKPQFLFYLLFALTILTSCVNHDARQQRLQSDFDENYIVVFDSCEYIIFLDQLNTRYITHRGRCEFCKQRNSN